MEAGTQGIEIKASHNPLAWFLFFTKLTVEVDGDEQVHNWGRTHIPAAPGQHRLKIWFRYFGRPTGMAETLVTVPESGAVSVKYRKGAWMPAPGRIEIK